MKHYVGAFALVLLTGAIARGQDFVPIFNGKDLTGWEGDKTLWSVSDGAITGTTSKEAPLKYNKFLLWKDGKLENFELKLKFRITAGNSGIQYRSKHLTDKGEYVVGGYQADFEAGQGFTGILYEERGRGILAQRGTKVVIDKKGGKHVTGQLGDPKEIISSYKPAEWNDYLVIAKGNHLQQFINGKQTIDVIDLHEDKRALEGILAFQIHVGPPMIVQFKDILLKRLPAGGIVDAEIPEKK